MAYTEDRTFLLRFSVEARFPEAYDGDEDGYAWTKEWEGEMKADVLKAVFGALRRHPHWTAHIRNRGASVQDEVEVVVTKHIGSVHD